MLNSVPTTSVEFSTYLLPRYLPSPCVLWARSADYGWMAEHRGTHSYRISPSGKFAVWTRSDADTPSVTRLVSLPEHNVIETLEDNAELHAKIDALKLAPVEFFEVEIEEGVASTCEWIKLKVK